MAILKVRKSNNPFELIPRRTLQDQRLSITELGALVRLISLPEEWKLVMHDVENRLKIGRDQRRKIFNVFEITGYLARKKGRGINGAWDWEFTLFAESQDSDGASVERESFPTDVNSGDGVPSDGSVADIESTYPLKTNLENTQPLPHENKVVVGGDDLIFSKKLDPATIENIKLELLGLTSDPAQKILDVLATRLDLGSVQLPILFVRALVSRHKQGQFDPTPGLKVAAGRDAEKKHQKYFSEIKSAVSSTPEEMARGLKMLSPELQARVTNARKPKSGAEK